jgi:hypothetical protein
MRIPTTKEFELLALGAIAVGTIYQFSSSPTSLLGVATWNLGGRLLMRCTSNYCFKHSRYEHIIVKAWDVPVNVAMTTFLSSGIAPSLVGFELGVKFAQSFAYGIVGGIIKDFASSAVNNLMPSCDQKEEDKGKSIPAGKHTTDCLKYFLVQLTKFTLSPLKYISVLNIVEQSFAGFMRNLMSEVVNSKDAFKDCRDQLIMGAITHPIYMAVPPMIFSSSTFITKCSFAIIVDGIERVAYHASNDKPFTTLVSQFLPSSKEKTA